MTTEWNATSNWQTNLGAKGQGPWRIATNRILRNPRLYEPNVYFNRDRTNQNDIINGNENCNRCKDKARSQAVCAGWLAKQRSIPKLINKLVRQPVLYGTPTYIRRVRVGPLSQVTQSYLRCKGSLLFWKAHKIIYLSSVRGPRLEVCEWDFNCAIKGINGVRCVNSRRAYATICIGYHARAHRYANLNTDK